MESSQFEVQNEFPYAFECTSGELLFGQMQCILEGMGTKLHDGMVGPTRLPVTGTIVQNNFKYRTAARSGRWAVSRVYVGHQNGPGDHNFTKNRWLIGYIAHHVDVSPTEYVHRASIVGQSLGNRHDDKGIIYVNRYDWSSSHGTRSAINVALGPGRPYTVPQLNDLRSGRLIVIDASRAQTFINTVRNCYLPRECYSLRAASNDMAYGVHLDCATKWPDYELGWLGFSGEKHSQFSESDELVAIIYDHAYHGLCNLESTEALLVENVVARTGYEVVEDKEDADDEYGSATDSSESSETQSTDDMIAEDELTSLKLPEGPDTMPPPSISDVRHLSGHTVLISGSTLSLVTTVFFGDEIASFKVNSNTQIEVSAPGGVAGSVGVKVLGPGGVSNIFDYAHPIVATINSLNPNNGSRWGGNVVEISGHHLDRTTDVMFGHLPAIAFEIISDTQMNATAPAGFPVPGFIEVTLHTPYEVGKTHKYAGVYQHETAPENLNYDTAITTWQRAINRDPTHLSFRFELAEVYERIHDFTALISLWNEASQLEPKNSTVLDNLAKAYAAAGNFQAAIDAWQSAMQTGADEKHIFLGLANAYDKVGNAEASVEMTNEAERMWPPNEGDMS